MLVDIGFPGPTESRSDVLFKNGDEHPKIIITDNAMDTGKKG